MAAKKKPASAMDFIVQQLKRNPKIEYAVLSKAAAKKGLKIYPINYGRALALLGLSSPTRKARRRASQRVGKTRGRARAGATNTADALQTLATTLRQEQQEIDRLRQTLTKIRDLIDAAL